MNTPPVVECIYLYIDIYTLVCYHNLNYSFFDP